MLVGPISVNRKTTLRKDSVLKISSAPLLKWVVWVVLGPLGRFSVRPNRSGTKINEEKVNLL